MVVCVSPNRIFLHDSIKDTFTERLVDKVKTLKVGNGMDSSSDIGPLIREDAIDKIQEQLDDATSKGAKILLGGERLIEGDYAAGSFYAPTILDGVDCTMDIFYKETFGPVIPLISYSELDEVIEMANDTEFGLASYAFASSAKVIQEISRRLEYGMVGINATSISQPETPFGGVKHSGFGRENSHLGIKEYVIEKFVNTRFI